MIRRLVALALSLAFTIGAARGQQDDIKQLVNALDELIRRYGSGTKTNNVGLIYGITPYSANPCAIEVDEIYNYRQKVQESSGILGRSVRVNLADVASVPASAHDLEIVVEPGKPLMKTEFVGSGVDKSPAELVGSMVVYLDRADDSTKRSIITAFDQGRDLCRANMQAQAALTQQSHEESLAQTQQAIIDQVLKDDVQPVIDVLRQQARGDPNLRSQLSQLTFRANPPDSYMGYAYGTHELGGSVVINLNLLSAITSLSELNTMDTGPYKQQAADWWKWYRVETTKSKRTGSPAPAVVLRLGEYVPDSLHQRFIRQISKLEYDSAIAWVVLHEIAHHVAGDAGNPLPDDSRQRELRADDWAFRKLQELHYPLLGVYACLNELARHQAIVQGIVDGQDQPATLSQLKQLEVGMLWPLWDTRAKALAEHFDVNAQPQLPFVDFRAMDTFTHTDGSKSLFDITVFFPVENRAATWGMGQLYYNELDERSVVWVEYKDGRANIYGANGHLKLAVETPSRLGSWIDYLQVSSSGTPMHARLFGWYECFAQHQTTEVAPGFTLYDALQKGSPADFLRDTLNELDWDRNLKDAAIQASSACSARLNDFFLRYHKGLITLTEGQLQSAISAKMEECQGTLKAILGEQRSEILRTRMMNLIQSAFPNGPPTD